MWRAPAVAVVLTSQAMLLSAVGLSAYLVHQLPIEPPPVAGTCPAVEPCPAADTSTEQAWRAMALAMLDELALGTPEQLARLEAEGIVRLSAQAYLLDEEALSAELASTDQGHRSLRVVPYHRDGEAVGFRLSAIRRGTLLDRLGLKNGDVLLQLNGEQLTHASRCFEVIQRRPEVLTVKLLRRGEPHLLVWRVVDRDSTPHPPQEERR